LAFAAVLNREQWHSAIENRQLTLMFCPRCSAQNSDDTKYCRACGINLATVSLALSSPQQLSQATWENLGSISLAKRRAGISNLIHGSGWMAASTIVGVALGLFSNTNDWIFVWLGLASWMACWGMIQFSQGVNKLVEARFLQRELGPGPKESTQGAGHELPERQAAALAETPTTTELAQPDSVTDRTTELLNR
jgi:ribosomal protein L40E